jgi:hypothetical protein
MSDVLNLLKAVGGMFLVLTLWVSIQAFVRRRSGCKNPDKDVLDFMLNGCGGSCSHKANCHSETAGTGGVR